MGDSLDALALRGLCNTDNIFELLEVACTTNADSVYATDYGGSITTYAEMASRAKAIAARLQDAGVRPGSRVAISLPNSREHIAVIFATLRCGAVWVPLSGALRGSSLEHQLIDSHTTHVVSEPKSDLAAILTRANRIITNGPRTARPITLTHSGSNITCWSIRTKDHEATAADSNTGLAAIMYTSGTTGPAKGVQVSHSMLIGAAAGALAAATVEPEDVLYVWEPLYHIGGAQLILAPLLARVRLALSRRLSIRRFWTEVESFGATHIHHLGGILQMLLSRPPSGAERSHQVRVSWGAGATVQMWDDVERRFGVKIHECYGMTETSSVVTVNKRGPQDGIGRALPWFEVSIDVPDSAGAGELLVRSKLPGLITTGYLNRPDLTERCRINDWWRTGDLAYRDSNDCLHFGGRANDSIRVRGENVSAWQVESVFSRYPAIAQCAAVGVDAQIGEQDILLCIEPVNDESIDLDDLIAWAGEQMPSYQIPRYVQVFSGMPMTPSRRVAKGAIPIDLDRAVDLHKVLRSGRP